MALIYALRRDHELLATGTAKELAMRANVSTADIRKMATPEWREKYPKMPYAEVISIRVDKDKPWVPCKKNDFEVYKLVKMGLSFTDVADFFGISEIMAENAYNRAANGRYGPCELF